MTLLLTGFDPFSGHTNNSSQLLLEHPDVELNPEVSTQLLRTSFSYAPSAVLRAVETRSPRAVLMFGLAASTSSIRLERFARNRNGSSSIDNDGSIGTSGAIVPDGPAAYPSSLPMQAMARVAQELGEAVEFSDDAGGFVCNHTFYRVAHDLAVNHPQVSCGFIHLPHVERSSPRLDTWAKLVGAWAELIQSA